MNQSTEWWRQKRNSVGKKLVTKASRRSQDQRALGGRGMQYYRIRGEIFYPRKVTER
jgi:hypothetical protein